MSKIGYINVSMEAFGGILSLIFIISIYIAKPKKDYMEHNYIRLLTCNTLLLFCDAAAWLFKGQTGLVSFYAVRISNFFVYVLGYVMLILFTFYFINFLKTKNVTTSRIPFYIVCAFSLVASGMVVLSQFNHMYYFIDEANVYHRQNWFWLSQVFGIIGMMYNGYLLIVYRKYMSKIEILNFGVYIFLPAASLLLQILFYGIAVLYLATTIILLCIYISIQMKLSHESMQKEMELEKNRTAIMLSQIQPHFLYNSLLGIKQLCDIDAQKASDALEHFSYYLRSNLDSLSDVRLIPFEKELIHVQDYLYLEKMRFEERINIQWDLAYKDFMLPSLTLQPIVENAVRYGITKKNDGGLLTIQSELVDHKVIITVRDDGVGFDLNESLDTNRTHIGIENVRNRLNTLCNGYLIVKSVKGLGTEVKIILPQREDLQNENHSS